MALVALCLLSLPACVHASVAITTAVATFEVDAVAYTVGAVTLSFSDDVMINGTSVASLAAATGCAYLPTSPALLSSLSLRCPVNASMTTLPTYAPPSACEPGLDMPLLSLILPAPQTDAVACLLASAWGLPVPGVPLPKALVALVLLPPSYPFSECEVAVGPGVTEGGQAVTSAWLPLAGASPLPCATPALAEALSDVTALLSVWSNGASAGPVALPLLLQWQWQMASILTRDAPLACASSSFPCAAAGSSTNGDTALACGNADAQPGSVVTGALAEWMSSCVSRVLGAATPCVSDEDCVTSSCSALGVCAWPNHTAAGWREALSACILSSVPSPALLDALGGPDGVASLLQVSCVC